MGNHYKAAQFITAIHNSGGIISTIAQRVGCAWATAKKYIDTMPTIQTAYNDECSKVVDLAESVLLLNMQLVRRQQVEEQEVVDTSDVKWYLSRKGKSRGYADKSEHEISGQGKDGAITVQLVGIDPDAD